MESPDPNRVGRAIEVVLCTLCVVAAIAFAAWQRSVFLMIYAAVVTVLIPVGLVRWHKLGGQEIMRRLDKAMGEPTDDPTEVARWVP